MVSNVSVVICTHSLEREDWLREAIASVWTQRLPPREVIVVVDHNPSLHVRLQDLAELGVTLMEPSEPGLSAGRNTGTATAAGEVVAFLDDDAVASPTWLERLSTHYADPNVIGVGGAIEADWLCPRPRWFLPELDWIVGCSYTGLPIRAASVRNPIGANMSFRREAIIAAGGFRSQFGRRGTTLGLGATADETEFSLRLHEQFPEAVIIYEPTAWVSHLVPQSRANFRYALRRCYVEGTAKAALGAHSATKMRRQSRLRTERAYLARIIPAALARELRGSLRDPFRVVAAGATVAAVAATGAGFIHGLFFSRRPAARA